MADIINLITPTAIDVDYVSDFYIHGGSFGDIQGTGYVLFGSHKAVIIAWSDTDIQFQWDQSFGPPNYGTYHLKVVRDDSVEIDQVTLDITYGNYMVMTDRWPAGGIFGENYSVYGHHFGATPGTVQVSADGLAFYNCTIVGWDDTYASFQMPANITERDLPMSIIFILTTAGNPYIRSIRVEGGFFIYDSGVIQGITPNSVDQAYVGDFTAAVLGAGDSPGTVLINGEPAIVTSWSDYSITFHRDSEGSAIVPEGEYAVTIIRANNRSLSINPGITYENQMNINGVSPAGAPVATETMISVFGENFGESGTVDLSEDGATWYPAVVDTWSEETIYFITPDNFLNANSISIRLNVDTPLPREYYQEAGFYFYIPEEYAFKIISVTPDGAPVSTPMAITIDGFAFGENMGDVEMSNDGGSSWYPVSSIDSWSDTEIQITTTDAFDTAGTLLILITREDGLAVTTSFYIYDTEIITPAQPSFVTALI